MEGRCTILESAWSHCEEKQFEVDKTRKGRHIFRHVITFTVSFGEKSSKFQQTEKICHTASPAGMEEQKSVFHSDLKTFCCKGFLKCKDVGYLFQNSVFPALLI